jgi:hypothetical protein
MFIPDPDLDFLPIPDPGSRGQKGTGFWILDPDRNTGEKFRSSPFQQNARDPREGYFSYCFL